MCKCKTADTLKSAMEQIEFLETSLNNLKMQATEEAKYANKLAQENASIRQELQEKTEQIVEFQKEMIPNHYKEQLETAKQFRARKQATEIGMYDKRKNKGEE